MTLFRYLVAVGSNLGDRHRFISLALAELKSRQVEIEKISTWHETKPLGAADQMFVNGAIVCLSPENPENFLNILLAVETSLGRQRIKKWGNREIDLDILLASDPSGNSVDLNSETLTIPHPHMWDRDFVMTPAKEIWDFTSAEISFSQSLFKRALKDSKVLLTLAVATVLRWFFASSIPFGNDEAYYWDWGRHLQLSYFDHPPFVSWLARLGQVIIPASTNLTYLSGRFFVPLCHVAATVFLLGVCERLLRRPLKSYQMNSFLLITQLVPAFSLGGMMLMPDVGLFLFSTWALWLLIKWADHPKLTWQNGMILGCVFGLAGLSKYHAAFIALGALGYTLWTRKSRLHLEIGFWVAVVAVGLALSSPVVIWNYQNQWASFLYQGQRGLSGSGMSLIPAARTLLGEILFVGPLLIAGFFFAFKNKTTYSIHLKILLWAALPLLLILKIFSFTSQTLPHWSMPSLWLLSPIAILALNQSKKWQKIGAAYGIFFCIGIPLVLSSTQGRNYLLSLMNNRSGGFGELTLWNVAKDDQTLQDFVTTPFQVEKPSQCPRVPTLASARWFTVAQIAANFPTHPIVINLDPNFLSYYYFRDQGGDLTDCPIIFIAEQSHVRDVFNGEYLNIIDSKTFVIAGHEDRPLIAAKAILISGFAQIKK